MDDENMINKDPLFKIKIYDTVPEGLNTTPVPIGINSPEVWGPSAWKFLHIVAISYPIDPSDAQKQNAKNFIMSLPMMLPCEECSRNCQKYVLENLERDGLSYATSCREGLFKFFWELHNKVNKRNNKPILTLSEAVKLYKVKYKCVELRDGHKTKNDNYYYLYILPAILLILTLILIYNN